MIFVGYEPGSKGYQFWDAAHWRFKISCDVKFDETLFPVKEVLKSQTSLNDPPISHSDNESEKSGLEIVIPTPPSPRLPSPGQSATHPQPPNVPVTGPSSPPSIPSDLPAHSEIPEPRYSLWPTKARAARASQTSGNYIQDVMINVFQEAPNSYREAINLEESDKWLTAAKEEFQGLMEMGGWKLVDHPADCKTIKCRWTFVLKANGRNKVRLVAKGYTQVQGIDYKETFSLVARYELI